MFVLKRIACQGRGMLPSSESILSAQSAAISQAIPTSSHGTARLVEVPWTNSGGKLQCSGATEKMMSKC